MTKNCKVCGSPFDPGRHTWQKYCSKPCKRKSKTASEVARAAKARNDGIATDMTKAQQRNIENDAAFQRRMIEVFPELGIGRQTEA